MTTTNPSPNTLGAEQTGEFKRTLQVMLEKRVPPASLDDIGSARHQAQTRSLEAALSRIAEGTYGSCRWCGNPIPVKRLEVVPNAQGCLDCATART